MVFQNITTLLDWVNKILEGFCESPWILPKSEVWVVLVSNWDSITILQVVLYRQWIVSSEQEITFILMTIESPCMIFYCYEISCHVTDFPVVSFLVKISELFNKWCKVSSRKSWQMLCCVRPQHQAAAVQVSSTCVWISFRSKNSTFSPIFFLAITFLLNLYFRMFPPWTINISKIQKFQKFTHSVWTSVENWTTPTLVLSRAMQRVSRRELMNCFSRL